MQVRRMHNRAAANGAARSFNDKPEAASADGYSKTGQNALVTPPNYLFAPTSRALRAVGADNDEIVRFLRATIAEMGG
jgi:hypothetical protein